MQDKINSIVDSPDAFTRPKLAQNFKTIKECLTELCEEIKVSNVNIDELADLLGAEVTDDGKEEE
ncbi:MAG: hypothetical protein ACE5IR_11825 [bacterium]